MIVDIHTHAPRYVQEVPEEIRAARVNTQWNPKGGRPLVYTWAEYETAMEPVDRAICFNIAQAAQGNERVDEPYLAPTPQVNDETAAFVHAHPEKYLGFFTVHPDDPGMLDEAERCRTDLGLVGVKLGLNYQNVDPLGENAFRLFAYAQEHRLPVMLHQGTSPVRFADMDYAHPRHTDRIAMAFPDLPIIMAHVGHPFTTDALMVARKHPNVWADVSAVILRPWGRYQMFVTAMEWGVTGKLLFGSDYPASTPAETIAALRAANAAHPGGGAPAIPDDLIEEIIHRDGLSLLGLA